METARLLTAAACLSVAVAQLAPADFDIAASPVPGLPVVTPAAAIALPPEDIGSQAPAPGLKGVPGTNVTVLVQGDGSNCTAQGPNTRLSGSGTFVGTGLFVGNGTFNSTGSDGGTFTLVNATFQGSGNCTGSGIFTSTSSNSTLGGNGTIIGRGLYSFSGGSFNGSGSFSGTNVFFEDGVGTLYATDGTSLGVLNGAGNATGSAIRCTGKGVHYGEGAFQGEGQFTGRGYYYATQPSDSATFVGTGLLEGNGDCGPGGAERTIYTAAAAPASDLEAVISEGDQAYADVQQVATLLAP